MKRHGVPWSAVECHGGMDVSVNGARVEIPGSAVLVSLADEL